MAKSTNKFISFIAYPLGYYIYCSTTWITFFLCLLYITTLNTVPEWQYIVIGVIAASGAQHIIVSSACRWLIDGHPDLDNNLKEP